MEDTGTLPEELDVFGEEVRGLVAEVSDDKTLPKMERKRLQVLCENWSRDCVCVNRITVSTMWRVSTIIDNLYYLWYYSVCVWDLDLCSVLLRSLLLFPRC